MFRIIFILSTVLCFSACDSKEENTSVSNDIKLFSSIIRSNTQLPSSVLEVDFVEISLGDGDFGPSDFVFYARFKVSKSELPKWIKGLKEINNTLDDQFPTPKFSWWLKKAKFETLNTYEAEKYFGRPNGWLAIDKESGYIYAYTFTM